MVNIWKNFHYELGYINASNQYIELATRSLQKDHGRSLSNVELFASFSREHGLTISVTPDSFMQRISNGYIVSIHTCVETSLKEFHIQPGTPVFNKDYNAEKDGNWLKWTLYHVYGDLNEEINTYYHICNYYRLIRNHIVHTSRGSASSELRSAYTEVMKIQGELLQSISGHLNAPNMINNITFDDQVLFSRAAQKLIKHIINDSEYNLEEILCIAKEPILKKIRGYSNNQEKLERKIKNYLLQFYPECIFCDTSIDYITMVKEWLVESKVND